MIQLPERAKVSYVVDLVRAKSGGRRPILKTVDEDEIPPGFLVSALEEPRTILVNFADSDTDTTAAPSFPAAKPIVAPPLPRRALAQAPSRTPSTRNPDIPCDVVFPDGSCHTLEVPDTATVSDVVSLLGEKFNGRYPIVTSTDDALLPAGFLVSSLEAPRRIMINFTDPDSDPASEAASAVAGERDGPLTTIPDVGPEEPTITLIHDGKPFRVGKIVVSANLRLFRDQPVLLEAESYEVRSSVAVDVFEAFVKAVEGEPIEVTESNASSLVLLCCEFGFEKLKDEGQSGIRRGSSEVDDLVPPVEEASLGHEELALENVRLWKVGFRDWRAKL
jgi:hypothetical protein